MKAEQAQGIDPQISELHTSLADARNGNVFPNGQTRKLVDGTIAPNDGVGVTKKAAPDIEDWPDKLREIYTPIRKLGQGTQGSVYLALRNADQKKVAIKAIRIHSVQNWKEYELFKREAMALKSIRMKGVAEFYDYYEFLEKKNPIACIVQEYIDGRSLLDMIRSGYRFTMRKIFEMAGQILDILENLHSHEPPIIHRDIKPSNILIKMQNADAFQVYLIDFGAVANPQVQGGGSTVAGTYGYMPPEQLMGSPCAASDFYSFAATLAHVLSGIEPAKMDVTDFRLVIDPHLQNIPRPVVRLLHRMLEPKADSRFTDVHVLRDMFASFAVDQYPMLEDDKDLRAPIPYTKNWEELLQNVQKLGQPGNMDLWMMLPESTNRGKLPECMQKGVRSVGPEKTSKLPSRTKAVLGCVLVMFLYSLFFAYISNNDKVANNLYFYLLIIALIVITIAFLISAIWYLKASWENKHQRKMVASLYAHGRKGIATVVSVSSVAVSLDDIADSPTPSWKQYYSQRPLLYRLRYSFNPPDDSMEDALVHEVLLNHDPTNVLQPGTPLPILYFVSREDNACVVSMPFPIPIRMLGAWNPDCFCTTVNGKKVNLQKK